jgi:hypothetical protein
MLSAGELEAVIQPILDSLDAEFGEDTSLVLSENVEFWDAIGAIQEAQHWKSWRFGVHAGRLRQYSVLDKVIDPPFVRTLMMVGVLGSVFGSILRSVKSKAAPALSPQQGAPK